MKTAGFAHLFKLAPQTPHALADHTPIGLDLSLARPAQKAKAAALAF